MMAILYIMRPTPKGAPMPLISWFSNGNSRRSILHGLSVARRQQPRIKTAEKQDILPCGDLRQEAATSQE